MTDMLTTITPKSDQLNFDDFTGGQSKTIKITKVSGISGEQPIAISYEGDNGKPWKPCKSMRRVLVHCWGADGHAYVGRSLTLYGDPTVRFGGMEVGGIRISHMSDIPQAITLALTATKAQRKPFTVRPLVVAPAAPPVDTHALELLKRNARDNALGGIEQLQKWFTDLPREAQANIKPHLDEFKKIAERVAADKAVEATVQEPANA